MKEIVLRPFKEEDLPLFKEWLYQPHVAEWYEDPLSWIEEVENRNTTYDWIKHFVVLCEDEPMGFCQYYEYYKGGEDWHGETPLEGTYSIDYLIGDTRYLKQGLGTAIAKQLIEKIREVPNAKRIIVQPDYANKASCNTLLTNGFSYNKKHDIFALTL